MEAKVARHVHDQGDLGCLLGSKTVEKSLSIRRDTHGVLLHTYVVQHEMKKTENQKLASGGRKLRPPNILADPRRENNKISQQVPKHSQPGG